ncbi:MAG: 3-hydroxyacyl-CoA dehydrogenase family protein [bacterium]|nr:3-hydroxyacyl-CoA dehydrogenase family protein [bacterium]
MRGEPGVVVVAAPGVSEEIALLQGSAPVAVWDIAEVERRTMGDPAVRLLLLMADADPDAQKRWLATVGRICGKETVVGLFGPGLSVTELATAHPFPSRVVGFSFLEGMLQPGGIVEIAPGLGTDSSAVDAVDRFFRGQGLETERVTDFSGLVLRRVLFMIINEAVYTLWEGVASREDIDLAMKLGTNYPMGPLEWADAIGLDRVYGGLRGLYEEYGEDRYRPCPLLRKMVAAGELGKKAGKGFYPYNKVERA